LLLEALPTHRTSNLSRSRRDQGGGQSNCYQGEELDLDESRRGTVFWLTGLSGAGKTTIGRLFHRELQKENRPVVFLDGDVLREVFGNDLGHSREERLKSAMRNSRLCKMLSDQGIDVVCATISLYRECQDWNRAHISGYHEIYLRVPMKVLVERDQKQLYSRALRGEVKDVMGVDLPVEEPRHPELIVENDGSEKPAVLAQRIFDLFVNSSRNKKK
jgi:adenylylsulfate kinase